MAVASLFSSESPSGVPSGGPKRSARLGLRPAAALVLLVALAAMAGCVTVRPAHKETENAGPPQVTLTPEGG